MTWEQKVGDILEQFEIGFFIDEGFGPQSGEVWPEPLNLDQTIEAIRSITLAELPDKRVAPKSLHGSTPQGWNEALDAVRRNLEEGKE